MTSQSDLTDTGIFQTGETVKDGEYEIVDHLGRGNSGEVYRISHPRHGRNRVIKLFVPFYELGQLHLGGDAAVEFSDQVLASSKDQPYHKREYRFLSQIDHPFVVSVHDSGLQALTANQTDRLSAAADAPINRTNIELPIIVASYVHGDTLSQGLRELNRAGVIRVLRSLAEALDYIHTQHSILHLDLKSANVRVRPDGYPILLDFALSQDLSQAERESDTTIKGGIDWDLTPFRLGTTNIAAFINRVQNMAMSKQEFYDEAFPALDLFQVGLMLRDDRDSICRVLTPAEISYLDVLIDQLTDWHSVGRLAPGELFDRVKRIDATQFYLAIRPGSMSGGKEILLSSRRRVFVPPKLVPITEHPELTRLNRLNQLSLLPAEFAGATHSRYEHCLDVFRLAQKCARRLLDQPECRRILSEIDVEMMMVAALLHDINHIPMTHLYQEAGVPLLGDDDLFEYALQKDYGAIASLGQLIADILEEEPGRIHRLIEGRWEQLESEADQVISSLINSGIDLDKMSYLALDSERSGLGFATAIDTDALLDAMRVVKWRRLDPSGSFLGEGYHVAFAESALPLVEAVVMARTRAFRDLYWCDANRMMMARFLRCVRRIANTPDGARRLRDLIYGVRSETDFGVLSRLDALASEILDEEFGLSSMFDALGGLNPTLVYSSSNFYTDISRLGLDNYLAFESALVDDLATVLPSLKQYSNDLVIDVPSRPLGLGGQVLVSVDGSDTVVDALERSDTLKAQRQELERLSSTVRIFLSGQAGRDWSTYVAANGQDDAEQRVGAALGSALGHTSLR